MVLHFFFVFFENRGPFSHKSLGGCGRLPPAVLFLENRGPFSKKSLGGVGRLPPAVFFFKTGSPVIKVRDTREGSQAKYERNEK